MVSSVHVGYAGLLQSKPPFDEKNNHAWSEWQSYRIIAAIIAAQSRRIDKTDTYDVSKTSRAICSWVYRDLL